MNVVTSRSVVKYCLTLLWLLGALSAVVWVVVGSVGYWAKRGWLPSDTAGWAQAIGAIVAIMVAIAVPYYQNQAQKQQDEDAERRTRLEGINATMALMSHVETVHKRLLAFLSMPLRSTAYGSPERLSMSHELKQTAAMIKEIPVTSLSNSMVHFLVGLREITNYGEFIALQLTEYPTHLDNVNRVRAEVASGVALIQRWCEELELLEDDIRSE
ncbi:TPA: hypothetical protein QEM39_003704 [Pseudomonas putida]|uniref:hypothetical protein n=1 Tax=Pseudomonas putida TaxID=303 RepID=UPI0023647C2E|nr:hypothetical protein [Pseudomonas putida]MDD2149920.1 hypothetical protein [Pseudomonas putida]HDS1682128.1 hypothetical protein [Pseudomonas putida]